MAVAWTSIPNGYIIITSTYFLQTPFSCLRHENNCLSLDFQLCLLLHLLHASFIHRPPSRCEVKIEPFVYVDDFLPSEFGIYGSLVTTDVFPP